jgi:hypothetical protein
MRRFALCFICLGGAHAYTRVYDGGGGLEAGWTAQASPGAAFALQAADSGGHAGATTSLSVTLPAGGSLSVSRSIATEPSAQLALYVRPPPSVSLSSLALSLAVNNVTLCVLGGSGACSTGLPDAGGWLRVAANLSAAHAAVRELRLRSGAATARFSVGDAVLATAADVATRSLFDINAPFCSLQLQSVVDACAEPVSDVCCASFSRLNDAGCFCVAADFEAEAASLQLSSQLAAPSLCGGDLDSAWLDGPACFQPPSSNPPGWDPSGAPPLPGTPALPSVAEMGPAPLSARGVGAYVGIAAATLVFTSVALAAAVSDAEAEMTRHGSGESWLHRCAARQPPWMLLRPCA